MITHSELHALKESISHILGRALAGYTDDYKHITEGHTFIQWGKVEQDMHAAIDALIPEEDEPRDFVIEAHHRLAHKNDDAAPDYEPDIEPDMSNDAEDRYYRKGW